MSHHFHFTLTKRGKWLEFLLLLLISGCFLYMLCPWRIWGHLLFAGYTEIIFYSIFILSTLLICTLSLNIFIYKKTEFIFSASDILFSVIFIILFLFALFSSVNTEIVIGWISYISLYALVRNVKRKYHIYILYVFPLAVLFQLFYGIKVQTNYFMPGKGLELVCGTFSNTGIWAEFVGLSILIAVGMLIYRRSVFTSLFWGIYFLPANALLIIADSRAAWLSTLAGVSFLLWQKFHKLTYTLHKKKIVITTIFMTIAGIILFQNLYRYKSDSANGRLLIWQVTGKMIRDKPIFGFGTDGFRKNYMSYQGEHFKANNNSQYKMLANNNLFSFNEFLNIGVEYGIVGICFAAIFILSLFKKTHPIIPDKYTPVTIIAKSCIFSFIVFGLFSYPLSVWPLTLVFIFFTALAASVSQPPHFHLKKIKSIPFILIAANFILFYSFLFPYSKAFRQWNKILSANIPTDSTLHMLNKIQPTLEQHPSFLLNYGIRLNRAGKYREAIPILSASCSSYPSYLGYIELGKSFEKIGEYQKAEQNWTWATWMVPHKFTPLYLQMQMNLSIGKLNNAYNLSDSILHKEIKLYSPGLNKILREAKQVNSIKQK